MQSFECRAKVMNGHLPSKVRQDIASILQRMDNQIVHIKMEKSKKKRTLLQNDWYKGHIVPFVTEHMRSYGNIIKPDEVDHIIKKAVDFMREVTLPDGSKDRVPRSTTELDTLGFNEFVDSVIAYAAMNWKLQIKYPHEEAQ